VHELSLARAIVGIVREQMSKEDVKNVSRVNVRIGSASGVVPESLRFAFQALTADDPLCTAGLVIDVVPFRVHCLACGADSENQDGLGVCGGCGGADVEIRSGTELEVSSIEIRDAAHEYHDD
jgi:hydrogenase nickel incorporation protein HypA/HybF